MFEFLAYPFMQRAMIGGIISAVLLGWVGVYVTCRNMSFIGDGVAHASLAAIAIALLVGAAPLPFALLFGMGMAVLLYVLEHRTAIAQDAAIGILFTTSLALGVVLLQFHQGYVPELVSFLFGNILSINRLDVWVMIVAGVVIAGLLFAYRKQFLFLTVDPIGAELSGVRKVVYDVLLYVIIAFVVVLSVKLVGIILVSGLLILPSATTKPFAKNFGAYQISTIIVSLVTVVTGLWLSFVLDLPSGASIVLFAAIVFMCSQVFAQLLKQS